MRGFRLFPVACGADQTNNGSAVSDCSVRFFKTCSIIYDVDVQSIYTNFTFYGYDVGVRSHFEI